MSKSLHKLVGEAGGSWEVVDDAGTIKVSIGATQVLTSQRTAIAAPTGGATTDAEARTAIGSILTALRAHGLIAT